jgi:hypothetical protein
MEPRRFRSDGAPEVIVETFDQVSDPEWFVLFADIRVGNALVRSIASGDAQDYSAAYATWDSNPNDGFDSGWRRFSFMADLAGNVAWSVDGAPVVTYSGTQSYESVTEVVVVAAVRRPGMRMSFQDLMVTIRNSDTLEGAEHFEGSLQADTFNQTDPAAQQQQVLHVYAPTEGLNEVMVSGQVRLGAQPGVTPGPNEIFGRVLIRAA